ncbi:MAG: cold shock domain-containing protein [Sphingomonas sp.]|nr:cold shock domain-containing protein [Sphingomonas sp.]
MASYQRVALFLLFDSIEQDLVRHIRALPSEQVTLTDVEREKAGRRVLARMEPHGEATTTDLLQGLDMAEKYDVLLRHKADMAQADRTYFSGIANAFKSIIPIRNSVMHARPLTIEEYSLGFSFAQSLLKAKAYWPMLADNYNEFSKDPVSFTSKSIEFLDDPEDTQVLHNLPTPEHDDTGFLPRPELERELRKRILGRHPVITILGEGGNGKTALALQTLYGLVNTNDHPFEAIIWVTAKSSMLTAEGVRKIGDDVVQALAIVDQASFLEPGEGDSFDRLYRLLENNKILLVIDNLETIQGDEIKKIATDVPGESKLLITSRVPLGGDLSVTVGELSDKDSIIYIRRLLDAYSVKSLKSRDDPGLLRYLKRLHNKPLLIKWFVLGVKSGANPDKIVANPEVALRFCLENVVGRLGAQAKASLTALATISVPLSAQILEYVTELNAAEVEAALNELCQFGLVDLVASQASEQLYRLRPFARAYTVRVIAPKPELSAEIRSRYHRVEAQFRSARGQASYNPYSLKSFKVRSPAEMLAAGKLNQAVCEALNGDFESANDRLKALRITDPGYFEVYRAQGYISFLEGDSVAAETAYESALELAPEEPQLHFFYGCLLMRALDSERAREHFATAIKLDPEALPPYREAARNCLSMCDFEGAETLLESVKQLQFRSYKDKVVYTDVRIQLYVRKTIHRMHARDWESAAATVKDLAYYVYGLDLAIFDDRMVQHLLDVIPSLKRLKDYIDQPLIADLEDWIGSKFEQPWRRNSHSKNLAEYGSAIGTLKQAGLQETFGFLRADDGRETFVHENEAGEELWDWLKKGGRVRYDISDDDVTGRTKAINLRVV